MAGPFFSFNQACRSRFSIKIGKPKYFNLSSFCRCFLRMLCPAIHLHGPGPKQFKLLDGCLVALPTRIDVSPGNGVVLDSKRDSQPREHGGQGHYRSRQNEGSSRPGGMAEDTYE